MKAKTSPALASSQGPKTQQIPDLWKVSEIPELAPYTLGGETAKELIRQTWYIAHEQRKQIRELLEALSRLLEFEQPNGERCLCGKAEYLEGGETCPYCEARAVIAKAEGAEV